MKTAVALGLAVLCGAAAVALVALDMAFSLRAELQSKEGADFVTLARSDDRGGFRSSPGGLECASREIRLVVDNQRLWSGTVDVTVTVDNYTGSPQRLLDESWSLGRGETRSASFTVPAAIFSPQSSQPVAVKPMVQLTAQVGDLFLSTCVREAA